MNILTRTLFLFTIALLVGACSSTPEKDPKSSELEEVTTKTSDTRKQEPLVLFENSFYNQPFGNKRFSFKARGLPIKDALSAFSKLYSINILADSNVSGSVNVDFSNLAFDRAMEIILASKGYGWEWDNEVIRVRKKVTRIFKIDYVFLQRSGKFSSNAGISTNLTGSSQSGASGASTTLTQSGTVDFWKDLEDVLKTMISKDGSMHINRLSGLIQVSDSYSYVKQIEQFVRAVGSSIRKQVLVEAKIVEVTLREDNAAGIDWTQLTAEGVTGAITTLITAPIGGTNAKKETISLSTTKTNYSALLNALHEQGSVDVVSQPRIRILNNQSSVIKVGTDRTFFTQTVTRTPSTNNTTDIIITETPTTITEGLVLTVTPQISQENWIILDVSPVVTRVVDTITSSQGSTAPVLDIKQASSVLRMKDGDIILLGGLIQEEKTETERSIPILGSIPLIGYFFKSKYWTTEKKELVIMLSANVVS